MKKYFFLALVILGTCLGGTARAAVSVFVSIPPQRWLVQQVAGDLVDLHLLVQEGRNPHTFEPTPREVAALSRSNVWFVLGLEFEEQLLVKVRGVAPQLKIVDIAANLEKLPFLHEEDDPHGDEGGGHEEEHQHGEVDPHVWLSPPNLLAMAATIADTLAALDPDHAEKFRQNGAKVAQQLTELHKELNGMLTSVRGATFYVYHPSFGYFAAAYGLHQEPVELGGKSPSPRQLAKLIAKAQREQVKVIFVQPQFDTKSGEAIAAAIQGRVVPLNALAEDVVANLREMAVQIKQAMAR